MKRHPDLEREILLAIEADDGMQFGEIDLSKIQGYESHQIGYHVLLLHEAGFLEAVDFRTLSDRYAWSPQRLTMAGHEYLETIRDPEIWRRTKEGAEKVGSFSVDVITALAKGFIREQTKRLTGLEIDL